MPGGNQRTDSQNFNVTPVIEVGHDSSVGIVTRHGLDGPGIESRWRRDISAPVQTGPEAYPTSCTMGTGSFPGVKRPRRGVDHSPPSIAEVKERVELYLYSPSGPSWSVLGLTLPLPLPVTCKDKSGAIAVAAACTCSW